MSLGGIKIEDAEHAGHDTQSSLGYDYTRCSMYNLAEVEREFLRGEVSRRHSDGLFGVAISPGYFERFPKFEYKIQQGYCARTTYALGNGYGFNGFKVGAEVQARPKLDPSLKAPGFKL